MQPGGHSPETSGQSQAPAWETCMGGEKGAGEKKKYLRSNLTNLLFECGWGIIVGPSRDWSNSSKIRCRELPEQVSQPGVWELLCDD